MNGEADVAGRASITPSPSHVVQVMMSNRPASTVEKAASVERKWSKAAPNPEPFIPSGSFCEERYLGLPPAKDDLYNNSIAKHTYQQRDREENVVQKHKKWLKGYIKQKESERQDQMEAEMETERRKQTFSEQQAKIRQVLMNDMDVPKDKVEELMDSSLNTKPKETPLVIPKQKKEKVRISMTFVLSILEEAKRKTRMGTDC